MWIRNAIEAGSPISNRPVGKESRREMLTEYVDFLYSLFDHDFSGRRLRIAVDAGNGMAGHTAPAVLARMNAEVFPLYFELDGSFPNHEANPIAPENLVDLQKLVKKKKADIGLAFDGDADRCFLVDEKGSLVSPSALTALIADRELKKRPGATIIYNLISSKIVRETVESAGGTAVRSRVGHSYIKKLMEETGAIFGGEHSGHFYFKEFWRADSGMLAALHAIAALMESTDSLSSLLAPYSRYFQSGEINTEVSSPKDSVRVIEEHYSQQAQQRNLEFDRLDGLTVSAPEWWFNVRPSNTEPLLRLNAEANTVKGMVSIRDEVLKFIKSR